MGGKCRGGERRGRYGFGGYGRPELARSAGGGKAKAGNGYVSLTWDATGERTAYYQVRRGSMFGGPIP